MNPHAVVIAGSPERLASAEVTGVVDALRSIGFAVDTAVEADAATDRWADADLLVDLLVATDAPSLLACRRSVAPPNPGCGFVLVVETAPLDQAARRAVREADLVVATNDTAADAVRSVPLRSPLVELPTPEPRVWHAIAQRALARRHAATRLLARQTYLGRVEAVTRPAR